MRKFIISIICVVNISSAFLLSLIEEGVRETNKHLHNHPIATSISDIAGDIIGTSGLVLSSLPLSITRFTGLAGDQLPKLFESNIDEEALQGFIAEFNAGSDNDEVRLTGSELAVKHGYPVEEHEVETSDGYILKIIRIQQKLKSNEWKDKKLYIFPRKPVVFLMHGLLGSADDWLIAGPNKSLAYILADAGYDVWMGNARGNKYSRLHTKLTPSDAEFWQFSWDEIGRIDLPDIIDHVLRVTLEDKIRYIGHSQGTTCFFVMCSLLPEYNEKIAVMFALSPVAYMENIVSPIIRLAAAGTDIFGTALTTLGVNEFMPNNGVIKTVSSLVCVDKSVLQVFCTNTVFLLCGFNMEETNATLLPIFLGHLPAGAATRQLVHYGQGIVSREFRRYDFGLEANYEKYKSVSPPNYPVEKITAPVSLLYSKNDWLAHEKDVDKLYQQLPNCIDIHEVPKYNHLDFVFGLSAKEQVFDRIMDIMKDF